MIRARMLARPYRRAAQWVAAILLVGPLAACGLFTPGCPTTVDQAVAGEFTARSDDTIVAVGRVVRFVPPRDATFGGYDIDVRRVVVGARERSLTFVPALEDLPGIRPGDAVLIIGRNDANPNVLSAGVCTPLVRLSDEDLDRLGVRL